MNGARAAGWLGGACLGAATLTIVGTLVAALRGCGGQQEDPGALYANGGRTPDGGCPEGQQLCDGRCIDVTKDDKNCGTCKQACASTDHCCAMRCVQTDACDFALTGIEPAAGMQNGGDWLTLKGSGFAAGMRVYLGDGRAPVRVIDGATARIQTPPGPPGETDVKIVLAQRTSVLRRGFVYSSAGLLTPWKEIPMAAVRGENPGLAVLQDGRVLVSGGTTTPDDVTKSLNTIELFLRKEEKMQPATGTMGVSRWQSNAVTLLDGRVLMVGGPCLYNLQQCQGDAQLAELFDPATGTSRPTKAGLNRKRAYTRSVLLPDGRVLVAAADDPSLEIFDPDAETFTLVPHSQVHRFGFVVRLRDGRVLLGAGDGGTTATEIFDPDTNQIGPTGALAVGRSMLTAHTLPDGRVMVIGGASMSAGGIQDPQDTIELYDPSKSTFTTAPYKLSIGRCWHASALVRDGTVLVMGGYTVSGRCDSSVGTVDAVDPVKGTVTPFAALPNGKRSCEWNAVTLLDGSIVAVGGGACGTSQALPEIYFLPGAPIAK